MDAKSAVRRQNSVKSFLQAIIKLTIIMLVVACSLINPNQSGNDELQLQLQGTNMALQATNQSLMIDATKQSLQSTADALTVSSQSIITQPLPPPPSILLSVTETKVPSVSTVEPLQSFEDWIKTARILLFEDIVGIPRVNRYVKDTLEIMVSKYGISYDNVGSAKGWLKERLIFGAEGGVPWDVIIIAAEMRAGVSGELFEYLEDNLNKGTSVILESWYLDQISEGKIKPILKRCGVKLTNYVGSMSRKPIDLVLWPLTTHPILTEPNNYAKLTNVIYFWDPNDLGDYMELTGEGDAQLLIGRKVGETTRLGTLAVCLKGQLILQTFSSHNYYEDAMNIAWENYIWNALKTRFYGTQE